MSSYTYTVKYQSCTSDSLSNVCSTNCCAVAQGGILDPVQSCTTDSSLCINGTQTTTTAHKCGMDWTQNICHQQCCTITTIGDTVTSSCDAGMLCKGLYPRALNQANFVAHESEIEQALMEMPDINSQGKVAVGVMGGVVGLLLIVLVGLCWVLRRERSKYRGFVEGKGKKGEVIGQGESHQNVVLDEERGEGGRGRGRQEVNAK